MAIDSNDIRKLSQVDERWELAFADLGQLVDGVDLAGLVLAVDGRGRVRFAAPLRRDHAVDELVQGMFLSPVEGTRPGRPKRLVCSHAELADELRTALAQTPVRVVQGETPIADHAMEAMVQHLRPMSAPGLTVELPLWRATLDALCRAEPWRTLHDDFTFRLAGVPEIEGHIVVLLGFSGEQEGVVVYPDDHAHERFLAMATGQPSDFDGLHNLTLLLDPVSEYDEHEQEACRAAGLELAGGRMPRAIAMDDGEIRPLRPEEERRLLAAIEAVVGTCLFGVSSLTTAPAERSVRTALGRVSVSTTPT
ncbi:MAG: hypothetical protein H6738_05475 [Alphaproteobacteria bacterium]|nr:hypothetical protein [Alphaproteobacteria bacterium]MCB9696218.1 hypothetical protein [Alphaproteobacteria bacterium]